MIKPSSKYKLHITRMELNNSGRSSSSSTNEQNPNWERERERKSWISNRFRLCEFSISHSSAILVHLISCWWYKACCAIASSRFVHPYFCNPHTFAHWHTKTDFLDFLQFLVCIFSEVLYTLIRLLDICLSPCSINTRRICALYTLVCYIFSASQLQCVLCVWHECNSTIYRTPHTHTLLEILSPLFKLRLHSVFALHFAGCWLLVKWEKELKKLIAVFPVWFELGLDAAPKNNKQPKGKTPKPQNIWKCIS